MVAIDLCGVASLDQQCDELREQLDSYASQVSLDFEELVWLRQVAEHLDCCCVDTSVADVADEMLPGLLSVLGAKAMALVLADDPLAAPRLEDHRIIWFGTPLIPDDACRILVAALQQEARDGILVRNRGQGLDCAGNAVSSLMLAPLSRHQVQFGWLLALEKTLPELIGATPAHLMGDSEFGTVEAGVLGAAATLLSTHARNVQLFHEKELLLVGTLRALVNAIDAKDRYTCGHSDRVAMFSRRIARQLGLPEQEAEQIFMTGLLHDIGKIGVPDSVLRKPGRLTEEEFAQIKLHPEIGYEILKGLRPLQYVLPGVLHHHEAVDGSGYPHGLKGDEIPLFARILAVADSYDAMTSDRPYRRGMPTEKAEAILREGSGRQWDVQAIAAFMDVIDEMRAIACEGNRKSPALFNETLPRPSMLESIATVVSGARN